MQRKVLFGIAAILIILTVLIYAITVWGGGDLPVVNPDGVIALAERDLMRDAVLLMLLVVIPVFIFTFVFVWRYRKENKHASYEPDFDRSPMAECAWWGVPCLIIIALASLTYVRTHELDPFRPIESDKKPVIIQAVALDWKWLFIYPEEAIATVNYIQIPEKRPINFQITADAPMNSLWIPSLAGQMYAMPGMVSKLHIMAEGPGLYKGSSANLSGKGFAGMIFQTKVGSEGEYTRWVQQVKESGNPLDLDHYKELAKPSEYVPASYFVLKKQDLFNWIVMKYMKPQAKESQ